MGIVTESCLRRSIVLHIFRLSFLTVCYSQSIIFGAISYLGSDHDGIRDWPDGFGLPQLTCESEASSLNPRRLWPFAQVYYPARVGEERGSCLWFISNGLHWSWKSGISPPYTFTISGWPYTTSTIFERWNASTSYQDCIILLFLLHQRVDWGSTC